MAEEKNISPNAYASENELNKENTAAGLDGESEPSKRIYTGWSEEDEKIRAEIARKARLVAEQKLAAYEYAHDYRKKLERDKARQKNQAKLRREEERAAEKAREREELLVRINEALDEERRDALARNERADALLAAIGRGEEIEEVEASALTDTAKSDNAVEEKLPDSLEETVSENEAESCERVSEEASPSDELEYVTEKTEEETDDNTVRVDNPDDYASPSEDSGYVEISDPDSLAAVEIEEEEAENIPQMAFASIPAMPVMPMQPTAELAPCSPAVSEPSVGEAVSAPSSAEPAPVSEKKPVAKKPLPAKAEKKGRKEKAPIKVKEEPPFDDADGSAVPAPILPCDTERPMQNPIKVTLLGKREEEIPPYEVVEDIVEFIKRQGAAVTEKADLAPYVKLSRRVISGLLYDVKNIKNEILKNGGAADTPELIVEMVSGCARVLEIRCDNVSVATRIGERREAEKYARELAEDIERHGRACRIFNSFTGEHLTRVSSALPEHLLANTGRALIPHLNYRNNYVEVEVDELGLTAALDENVKTEIISVPMRYESLAGEMKVETATERTTSQRQAERARRRYNAEIARIEAEKRDNARLRALSASLEDEAEKKREAEMKKLLSSYPAYRRSSDKYKNKLERINERYESAVLAVRGAAKAADYKGKEERFAAELSAISREKVMTFASLTGDLNKDYNSKALRAVRDDFAKEIKNFNLAYAELSALTGKDYTVLPESLADTVLHGGRLAPIAKLAVRHELVETLGDDERIVGDRLKKTSGDGASLDKYLLKHHSFDGDKTTEDRSTLREEIMLRALKLSAESVDGKKQYKKYSKKARRAEKKLLSAIKATNRGIFRAQDRDGVISLILESVRLLGKLVELGALNLSVAKKSRVRTSKLEKKLTETVERYNTRVVDYEGVSGIKLLEISSFLAEDIVGGVDSPIPALTYNETYFEVYPKNAVGESFNTASSVRRGESYLPIDYKRRKITENPAVEITEINPPVSARDKIDGVAAESRGARATLGRERRSALFRLAMRSSYVAARQRRTQRTARRFDKKLARLNKDYDRELFKLESMTAANGRPSLTYERKVASVNKKYEKRAMKLRLERINCGIERYAMKLSAEEFAICRERLAIYARALAGLRACGKPSPVKAAKRRLINQIREHNAKAREFSRLVGEPIAEVSTGIVDDIFRNGREYKLPKLILAREVVETLGDDSRVLGDKYRYGMPISINASGLPVMKGTSYVVPGVGSPYVGLRSDGMPVIGQTDTGLPYSGAPDKTLGVKATVNPSLALKNPSAAYVSDKALGDEAAAIEPKMETAVCPEIDYLEKLIGGALHAKSVAVSDWRELIAYARRSRKVFRRIERIMEDHSRAIGDGYAKLHAVSEEIANLNGGKLTKLEDRLSNARSYLEELTAEKSSLELELENTSKRHDGAVYSTVKDNLRTCEKKISLVTKDLESAEAEMYEVAGEIESYKKKAERLEEILPRLYIRYLSAKGRLVELEAMNMLAASKIEIGGMARIRLMLSLCGYNPKKLARRHLEERIEEYNDLILEDPAHRVFTPISIMLPDKIAERDGIDDIPDLVFDEELVEIKKKSEMDEECVRISRYEFDSDVRALPAITGARSYDKCVKECKRLGKEIRAKEREVESSARRYQDRLEDIRERKLRASSRYERALIRITGKTSDTAHYQKKAQRALNRYRKKMQRLDGRERMPRINVKRWLAEYSGYNDKGLIYGLSGEVRASSVKLLNLERERLICASEALLKTKDVTGSGANRYRTEMKRDLIAVIVKYNRAADSCSRKLGLPLTRVDSMLPAFILREGKIPNIPEVVCRARTLEAIGDERFELK